MKLFPSIVTGIFILLALGGFFVFATFSSKSSSAIGTVVVWGSLPTDTFNPVLATLKTGSDSYGGVTYTQVSDADLIARLVEGIASGNGPDLVIFPEKNLIGQENKLQLIDYSTLSKRDFQNTFIQAGELFLGANGSFGLPFSVDPLVMYWNRTLFSNAGIAEPPTYWDELPDIAPRLTKGSTNGTLETSAVALGVWTNVSHAKEIFLTLMSQLGNSVVAPNDTGALTSTLLLNAQNAPTPPVDSVLRFYTEFADPTKPMYSWNRSQPNSHDAFVGGRLAIYFGFASELSAIRSANPNLNFDVAPMPQIRGGGQGAYAAVTALAVPRGAANATGALAVAQALTGSVPETALSAELNLPSVRRDVSPATGADPYAIVFRNASLSAFAFLDPNPASSDSIFQRMIDNISSGKLQVSDATSQGDSELKALLGVQ